VRPAANRGMPVTRRIARTVAALVAGGCALAAGLAPALPAAAHGAPVRPISRTAACATGGTDRADPACRAALAANKQAFGDVDNLRVPAVNGRDRAFVPDGRLCSGGLAAYRGLDLARTDWPATRLTAGSRLTVVYAAPIPHAGSFRLYLTRPGYDPRKPLRWSDLDAEPFLSVANPPLTGGAYRIRATLPANRTGRHVLYTVWQTTSTPDTYYSCSDLILRAAKPAAAPAPAQPRRATPTASASPAAVDGLGQAGGAVPAAEQSWLASAGDDDRVALGQRTVSGALIVLVGVTAGLALVRIRRARAASVLRTGERPERRP
jgi:predicted carbohydrate-binding protein with CBM5 and CBM33 domain